jgi:hypothetical protein
MSNGTQYRCVFYNHITNPVYVKATNQSTGVYWNATIPAGSVAVADPATDTGLIPGLRIIEVWDALALQQNSGIPPFVTKAVIINSDMDFHIHPHQISDC